MSQDEEGYEYEIFVSYCRESAVEEWLKRYFFSELTKWLPHELPPRAKARVYFDYQIRPGQRWPSSIQNALSSSRVLVSIFSSPYFASDWCLHELDTILAREQALGLDSRQQTEGLIYPVLFGDGDYVPDAVRELQVRDMRRWASTAPAFLESPAYLEFEAQVKGVASDLALMIKNSPPFDPDWPRLDIQVTPVQGCHMPTNPRLGPRRDSDSGARS